MTENLNELASGLPSVLSHSTPEKTSGSRTAGTIEQLTLLGYKLEELVFYRAIKCQGTARKLQAVFPKIPLDLEQINADGYNIYLVVNGCGEIDADITTCKAIFYEHDDISKEEQLILWVSLKLPEPTFQVDTGGKSIHSYWVFTAPIAVDIWKILQRDLLNYSNGDKSIKNPSRVMRLAGFYHKERDQLSTIVSRSGHTYSFEVLRAAIPKSEISQKTIHPRPEQASLNDIPPIPLENCLAKSNRELLAGVNQSGRNVAGATLSRDLIGTENYLIREGIAFTGDSQELFDRFADGCNPPLDRSESDSIRRSAEGDRPEPACTAEGVQNILEGWRRKHRRNDVDTISSDPDLAKDLKHSLELKHGKAPNVFGGKLGCLLTIAASNFNIPVEILTFCLLPILASQIDSCTELLINPGTDYRVPPVRWCALVGETGSKKSPILGLLTKALSVRQNELYAEYKENKLAYDAEYRGWKATNPKVRGEEPEPPPPLRDLYFGDFTIEGIILSLSQYPNSGYLLMLDELAAFFSAMDAYRGGKGGDRQKWLTIWNGGGIKVNRKASETICVAQSSISIVGGIQPQTIANLIGGDGSQQDGLWNRFAFKGLPHNTTEAFTETPSDLREELDKVYGALTRQGTQTHCLSLEAKPFWKTWHDEIESQTIAESNWLIKGTYAKFEGIAGRNALIIHRTLAAIDNCEPTQLVSAEVLELAIAWTRFELNQTLIQYQLLAIDDTDPEQVRILKFIDKFMGQGWINARAVSRWWTTKPFPSAEKIRAFMTQVVSLGYAIDNDESSSSAKYQIQITSKGTDNTDKQPILPTGKPLDDVGASTDKVTESTASLGNGVSHSNSFKFAGASSDNSKPLVNGHSVTEPFNNVGTSTDTLKHLQANSSSDFGSTVSTFSSNKNLKVGDRVHYLGGMIRHHQKVGVVKEVCGDRYICLWDKTTKETESLDRGELALVTEVAA